MVCPAGFSERSGNNETMAAPSGCPMTGKHQVRRELKGLPLGPDSLLWKYFDNRMALVASTGIKQLMMHEIDAGVDQHSKFFEEIVERTVRSMVQIGDTVYDLNNGEEAGHSIRDQHLHVTGKDVRGKRYHAMNPKLWADTHLTFVDGVFEVADRFDGHTLTDDEREMLYQESITWYQKYGVSDRYLPADYAEYKERSDEMAEEYVLTDTAKRALAYALKGDLPRPNIIPAPFWSLIKLPTKPASGFLRAMIVSGLSEPVREKYKDEIPYTETDKKMVHGLERTMQSINWDMVPGAIRYPEGALRAFQREGRYNGVTDHAAVLGYGAAKSVYQALDGIKSFVTTKR